MSNNLVRSAAVAGGGAGGGALADFGFTTAGGLVFATFFAAVPAASRARCLVAKSFALASIISAGEPSRAMRHSKVWRGSRPEPFSSD